MGPVDWRLTLRGFVCNGGGGLRVNSLAPACRWRRSPANVRLVLGMRCPSRRASQVKVHKKTQKATKPSWKNYHAQEPHAAGGGVGYGLWGVLGSRARPVCPCPPSDVP